MSLRPYYEEPGITIYHGDCRDIIRDLPPVDGIVTDPPYSSGGAMRSDRIRTTSEKYVMSGTVVDRPDFSGDNRDQRSFFMWCDLWLRDCLTIAAPGAVLVSFIDWRQLPVLVDVIQVSGWVYRGLLVWDKSEGVRPYKGWFRSQCEFMVLGSLGALNVDQEGPASPGLFRFPSSGFEKVHITGKPLKLIEAVLGPLTRVQTVLDPFMGSGTTLLAAKELGRKAIGIEMEERYCEIAVRRLRQEVLTMGPGPGSGSGLEGAPARGKDDPPLDPALYRSEVGFKLK